MKKKAPQERGIGDFVESKLTIPGWVVSVDPVITVFVNAGSATIRAGDENDGRGSCRKFSDNFRWNDVLKIRRYAPIIFIDQTHRNPGRANAKGAPDRLPGF
jgi:hypothetical protein